jgi:membrane-bound metal-dependent hydrolase YbcI (DUF457 family)
MVTITPWMVAGLIALAVAVTVAANALAARLSGENLSVRLSLGPILANLVWIALVSVAGVIAVRYIERVTSAPIGYSVFVLIVFVLSMIRALLYRRLETQPKPLSLGKVLQIFLTDWLHNLTYLFAATISLLTIALLTEQVVKPLLFIPLAIGALLPDLDSTSSLLGRLLPFASRRLEDRLGHLQEWHTLAAAAIIAVLASPLVLVGAQVWIVIPLGFVTHLIVDLLHPEGIMLFWPLSKRRYRLFGGPLKTHGGDSERRLAGVLALIALIMLLIVDIGEPPPQPVVVPSYEQTLERYYSLRGKNLVTAAIEGSWQATGRRASGRFEVINAADESFVLLDRYTGRVFTAGHKADDHFYPSRITLQTGPAARIKPVEVHLENQYLADALPTIYQMQREPGLQHIFVSGDIVVPALQAGDIPQLEVDYSQSSVRKIQSHDARHFSLHYLTASELIALASVLVDAADLSIWATYIEPETEAEPTVTPLPTPAVVPESSP